MWKILMFEISAKNCLCDVILGSEEKLRIWQRTFHANLELQIRICLLFKPSANIQGWQNEVNCIYEATCDETGVLHMLRNRDS